MGRERKLAPRREADAVLISGSGERPARSPADRPTSDMPGSRPTSSDGRRDRAKPRIERRLQVVARTIESCGAKRTVGELVVRLLRRARRPVTKIGAN
jgi:hypothetical protein